MSHLERWWTNFNEPALTSLIDEALANNLDLQAAMARIDAARAQVTLARRSLYPSARSRRQRRAQPASRESAPTPIAVRLPRDGQRLPDRRSTRRTSSTCGASTARRRAPRRTTCSRREFARETVRTVVAAEVARAYFGLLAADAQLRLLRDTLTLRNETVALQTDRAQAGVIGDYDLAQAKAERAAVTADIAIDRARDRASSNRRSPR